MSEETLKYLNLQTDIPKCIMTDEHIEEQKYILSLIHNPFLPPIYNFEMLAPDV